MRRAALLLIVIASACSSKRAVVPLDLPGIPRTADPSLALMTANGQAGHACPVDDAEKGRIVYTARHVMWNEETHAFEGASWSGLGPNQKLLEGGAVLDGVSPISDVAALYVAGDVDGLTYLPSGVAAAGEYVFWFEYDWRTKSNALRPRRRFAKVLRIVARHYVLDEVPVGGASGTCLISERGEAVGVVTGGWELDDDSFVGVAPKLPRDF